MRHSYILILTFFSFSVFGQAVDNTKIDRLGAKGVQDRAADDTRVVVYPNPTNASFTVKVELDKNSEVEIIVYNAIGKAIFSSREAAAQGTYYKPVTFNEQPAGLYFVHVKAGEIKSIERLIKVNQD